MPDIVTLLRRRWKAPDVVDLPRQQWKGPDEVEILTFTTGTQGEPEMVGESVMGRVYRGRMRFKDGSMHQVAIKRFKTPITDERAGEYQRTIEDLRDAGVRLPKMGMVRVRRGTPVGKEILGEDEWVQVSQLFYSAEEGSKIQTKGLITTREGSIEAITELTKVANAGYRPQWDLIEPFKDISKGVIPFDLDYVKREASADQRAFSLSAEMQFQISLGAVSNEDYGLLFNAAMTVASPEMKKSLRKYATP